MENLLFSGVPILKHIRVTCIVYTCYSAKTISEIENVCLPVWLMIHSITACRLSLYRWMNQAYAQENIRLGPVVLN